MPVDDASLARSGRERAALQKAKSAHTRAALWRVGAAVVGAFGVLSLLLTLIVLAVVSPGLVASLVALLVALVPGLVALYALRRGARMAKDRERELDEAWALVASEVVRERGREIDAGELARLMRLREEQAEQLLAQLNVNDFVRARVTDAGDLVYESVRARIDAGEADQRGGALDPELPEDPERARR